ncbi:MAG TPA: hypothetical protein VKB79_14640 [Bryobacteraceae bacterium]|nr:hypothetical protein [Bryobacteraceae bacterium]
MAIKALCMDSENTEHMVIGLTRANIESLLDGDVFTIPAGLPVNISDKSDVVLIFAETDEELKLRMSPMMAKVQ